MIDNFIKSEKKRAIKYMTPWDWIIGNIALIIGGIAFTKAFAEYILPTQWYWWIIVGGFKLMTPVIDYYNRPLLKKNRTDATKHFPMKQFKRFKQNMDTADWLLTKSTVFFIGIALAVYEPSILSWLSLELWILVWALIQFVPLYYIYHYKIRKNTRYGRIRAKYTRSKK